MISAQHGRLPPKSQTFIKRDAKQAEMPKCIDCGRVMLVTRPTGLCRGCERDLERE